MDRSRKDGGFGNMQDGLSKADPKRDISCFFSSCCIYWHCVTPACVYDSLIRYVGPNRTKWTWSSDGGSIFSPRPVFWYLNVSAATSTSKVTEHNYMCTIVVVVQKCSETTAFSKNTGQIEAENQPTFFKLCLLPKLNTKSVIWAFFSRCTQVTSHNKKSI